MLEVAVPMGLDILRLRLENNYYRSPHAFRHDVETIVNNCRKYNKAAPITQLALRMRDDLLGGAHPLNITQSPP
eukprot:1376733-Pyramimonas_sp.AAC.1